MAILISGQLARFAYKDCFVRIPGGLRGLVGCGDLKPEECPVTYDVHIVLSDTRVRQYSGPPFQPPPYEEGAFDLETIKRFYKDAGADHVSLKVIPKDSLKETISDVNKRIAAEGAGAKGMAEEAWWTFAEGIKNFKRRFLENGNMFYLRHAVFAAAVEAEHTLPYMYSYILYMREDNIFVHPPYTLMALATKLDGGKGSFPKRPRAAVVVDKFCGWGSYSDKIYFANRPAAEVLFPSDEEDHVSRIARWVNRAPDAHRKGDPLQTEEYLKVLLDEAGATVVKMDYSRNDLRYVKNKTSGKIWPCVAESYFKCTSEPLYPQCK